MPHHPPRRTVLTAGAAGAAALVVSGLIAGCSGGGEGEPPQGPSPSPEDEVRASAARHSSALLARYDATLTAHPDLAAQLAPLRASVAAHLTEFSGKEVSPKAPKASAEPAGETGVPAEPKAALTALADAERRTTDARSKALDTAPPETARLLASVAASGAVHGYLLTELLSEVD